MDSRPLPDYLIIGHVTHDLTAKGITTGGAVSYSGMLAHALGCTTFAVTSAGPDFDPTAELPELRVHVLPAAETTTYENIYTDEGRQQYIHKRAKPIKPADIPPDWIQAPIVHLAPLNMEIEPEIIHTFPNSQVGITPQGWLRKWDENGKIGYKSWLPDPAVLSKAAVLIVSDEDIPSNEPLDRFHRHVPIFVQTRGMQGCAVYQNEEVTYYPAPETEAVNLTGAGDIFATAFFIRLYQTESVQEAAVFANKVAALSITGRTLPEKIGMIKDKLQHIV